MTTTVVPGEKQRGYNKLKRIPVKLEPVRTKALKKPEWIKVRLPSGDNQRYRSVKNILRQKQLHTVCEEATCPNIAECFSQGTATFMILGDVCTRRCPFCDVAHGRPLPPDPLEAANLAAAIAMMQLNHVVVTSVDRDDLRDGGAAHFVHCIDAIRAQSPQTRIEILTPDFRGRLARALDVLESAPVDIFNHNIETVPRLYKSARPGADYQHSLSLLADYKKRLPAVPTKSGLMVGLGEEDGEVVQVLADLRAHNVTMLTIGQYLAPSQAHFPVQRYVTPEQFEFFRQQALTMGFEQVASGPMVRSSYHAEHQAQGNFVDFNQRTKI